MTPSGSWTLTAPIRARWSIPGPTAGFATDPIVSPDGRRLSFVGWDNSPIGPPPAFEPAQGLFTSTIAGADLRQLMPFSSDQAIKHYWSPDGGHLLMTTNANFLRPDDSANIAPIRPDGTGLRFLTSYGALRSTPAAALIRPTEDGSSSGRRITVATRSSG